MPSLANLGTDGDGQGVGTVANLTVSGNTVKEALYYGVGFSTSSSILLDSNTIDTPGLDGIVIGVRHFEAPTGSATISGNIVTGLRAGRSAFVNHSPGYSATLSGNSW